MKLHGIASLTEFDFTVCHVDVHKSTCHLSQPTQCAITDENSIFKINKKETEKAEKILTKYTCAYSFLQKRSWC